MVKKQKLFEKALNSPQNLKFTDFVTLLMAFGFVLERTRGSHHIFTHPRIDEILSIQPNPQSDAKPYQVRQFLKLVEQYNLRLKED